MISSRYHFRNVLLCLLSVTLLCALAATNSAAGSLYTIKMASLSNQLQGHDALVDVTLSTADSTRGLTAFDLTIAYDRTALNFREALPGNLVSDCQWEYFAYQWGLHGDCHGDCPQGVVRIVGTASLQGGVSTCTTPIPGIGSLPKTLFTLKFLTATDRSLACNLVPIRWFWMDCRDNILSTTIAGEQAISRKVFDLISGDTAKPYEITDTLYGFPTYLGAQTVCSQPSTGTAARLVDYYDSYIQFICPETLDSRGDINVNGVPNEVADYVMFFNYFFEGLSVFYANPAMQVAASDVNADGLTLQVGDLVYLGLVIMGKAAPYPKVVADPNQEQVRFFPAGDTLKLDAPLPLGAAYMLFDGNVQPTLLQPNARIGAIFDGSRTHVMVFGSQDFLPASLTSGPLLSITNLVPPTEAQACDTIGTYLQTVIDSPTDVANGKGNLPAKFSLEQNYPNPFNPSTVITFSLPRSTTYSLTIYSITGQQVAKFEGTAGPGMVTKQWDGSAHASGVYLYKLTAGSFTETKKMLLVK